MSLHYQTELRLGRRGRPIIRRYRGARAAVAIGIDLGLSLVLGVIELAIRLVAKGFKLLVLAVAAAMYLAVELVLAPVRVVGRLTRRRGPKAGPKPIPRRAAALAAKPPRLVGLLADEI